MSHVDCLSHASCVLLQEPAAAAFSNSLVSERSEAAAADKDLVTTGKLLVLTTIHQATQCLDMHPCLCDDTFETYGFLEPALESDGRVLPLMLVACIMARVSSEFFSEVLDEMRDSPQEWGFVGRHAVDAITQHESFETGDESVDGLSSLDLCVQKAVCDRLMSTHVPMHSRLRLVARLCEFCRRRPEFAAQVAVLYQVCTTVGRVQRMLHRGVLVA